MKSSTLQLRKISLIEYLLGIQDEKVFAKVESNIHKSIKSVKPGDFILSKDELIERAEFSNKQINKRHVLNKKKLEEQSKNRKTQHLPPSIQAFLNFGNKFKP